MGKGEWWIMGKVNVMGEQSGRGSVKGGSREGWVMGSGRAREKREQVRDVIVRGVDGRTNSGMP
jgi:hypothetical protein